MANSGSASSPREKCMKCREDGDLLLSSYNDYGGLCDHKFCQSCFRKENSNIANTTSYIFTCPCCHAIFHHNIQSIDEGILIGEATTLRNHKYPQLPQFKTTEISNEDTILIYDMNRLSIEKLEAALLLNPANFHTIYLLIRSCGAGFVLMGQRKAMNSSAEFYTLKLFDSLFKLLDHPEAALRCGMTTYGLYSQLATIFYTYHNYPTAVKYSKLAYEQCLRSSDHKNLSKYKDSYLKSRTAFSKLPPLRFAVGDEVEFLHELETGSEWKLGKVVELHYREREFDVRVSAPYRVQLLLEGSSDEAPVYAWVKADINRYVRKVGVRSIEDTRYQARLDAKVAELFRVYCSGEFIQDIYCTLAQDREFVEMLQSVWQIELAEAMLRDYRLLVMYREPLIHTESGYHVPSSEEVIAGIKAYFDPAHFIDEAPSAVSEDSSQDIRNEILGMIRCLPPSSTKLTNVQGLLLRSIKGYLELLSPLDSPGLPMAVSDDCPLRVPSDISEAVSRAVSELDLEFIQMGAVSIDNDHRSTKLAKYLDAWIALQKCLDNPDAGPACQCPFVYFFIKFCLDHGIGVPKLALALYDRMNMQLSREFIRCAKPTCELNRLDKSTGEVKFKLCSRCKAVIYCSRECQVAHYPDHKRLCREHSTDQEGS